MNAKEIVAELQEKYPGSLIKQLPEDLPTEIVCEFDPAWKHPEWSLAVAIIDRSQPHYHRRMTEVYSVIKGELTLHIGHEQYTIYEGQQYTIMPGNVHWAEGDATWVEVYCSPGYNTDDHILVD